jgi:Domain of unknown function (DUF397)
MTDWVHGRPTLTLGFTDHRHPAGPLNAPSRRDHCVEVGNTLTAVRDSKNPGGPVLPGNVPALLATVKAGLIG